MIDVDAAHKLSMHNRQAIIEDGHASCFFCIRTCALGDITNWTDEGTTALCPHCDIDALLPGIYSTDDLKSMCERWFCEAVSPETVTGNHE